jgi:Ni/Co efflux regulator RcnB
MKRLLLTAAAGLMIAGPLCVPAFAQQGRTYQQDRPADPRTSQPYQGQPYQGQPYQGQQGRDDNRGDSRDWGRDDDQRRDGDRNGRDSRNEHRQMSQYHDSKSKWRDTRRNTQWNDRDHNGYYVGREWHRGQPSSRDYGRRGFQLGYQPWQRGDRLGSYNQRYREVDYRDYRVQRPPQGYRWVKDDNGDLLMAAVVGGLIALVISNY